MFRKKKKESKKEELELLGDDLVTNENAQEEIEETKEETPKKRFGWRKKSKVAPEEDEDEIDENEDDDEDEEGVPYNSVWGGRLGDVDPRTKSSQRLNRVYVGLKTLTALGVVLTLYGHHEYHKYTVSNSTKFGTVLTYTQAQASVQLKSVNTDKNKDVTVVELKYGDTAHQKLSSKGTNYGINLVVAKRSDVPRETKMYYGLLGSDGNGYLIIKGKLKPEAYQFYILNRFTFDNGSSNVTDQGSNELDLERNSVEKMIADVDFDKADKNGIFSMFNATSTGQDTINFRINPYSNNTVTYNKSFLTKDGEVDFDTIIKTIGIDKLVKELDSKIKISKENLGEYSKAIDENTDRILENPNDTKAQTNLNTAQESYQKEKSLIEEYQNTKEELKKKNFSKSSFIDINDKYNLIVK